MSTITLMTTADMQTLAYALGAALLLVAVVGIVKTFTPKDNGCTYGASLDTDYEDYRLR